MYKNSHFWSHSSTVSVSYVSITDIWLKEHLQNFDICSVTVFS